MPERMASVRRTLTSGTVEQIMDAVAVPGGVEELARMFVTLRDAR